MLKRRQFLTHGCQLGLAGLTLSSTVLQLGLARRAAAQGATDYRALVCILLAGGNDSYNMVVPLDTDQYGFYQQLRTDLALARGSLLPLAGFTAGRRYGLHPGMPEVQSLHAAGELAVMANVGTLAEPFDAAAVASGSARLPLGLFSHSDQIAQWQTAVPDDRIAEGWGGRIADLMQDVNLANGISMNISLSGTNLFQSGKQVSEYSIDTSEEGASGINAYDDGSAGGSFRKRMIDDLLATTRPQLLQEEYRRRLAGAAASQKVFSEALQSSAPPGTPFSDNVFSQSLRQVARVVAARDALGARRQTFFITVGGWDHHDEVLENQAAMLPVISTGLAEFRNALVDIGAFEAVTTFTISDFGRTLTSNGKGSDHGWGGHHLVLGGAVKGGRLYGSYPSLEPGTPLDVGRGILAPTTATDNYFAELALWFGVSPGDLDRVLPNVRRFYTPGSGTAPVGFLL